MGSSQPPIPVNGTMFQAFEWHVAADGKHFRRLTRDIPALAQRGITVMWIPPAYKGQSDQGNGYGIYGKSPHPSLYVNWP